MEARRSILKVGNKELKRKFLTGSYEERKKAARELVKIKNDDSLNFFIKNLKNKDRRVQMSSASALRVIASDRAIKPLLGAIRNIDNKNYTGAFVYALQTHNYEDLLIPIINIALNDSFESQNHALQMLADGEFKTNKAEIIKARKLITNYLERQRKCENYETLIKEINRCLERHCD